MKELQLTALSLLLIFLIISCSSETYFIHSDYREKAFDNPTVLIPKVDDVKIFGQEKLFNEEEISFIKDVYKNTINEEMADYILPASNLNRIYHIDYKLNPELSEQKFTLGDNILLLNVPKKSIDVDTNEDVFILLVENPTITIKKEELDTDDPAIHYSTETTGSHDLIVNPSKLYDMVIKLEMQYALFDNMQEQVAYYGVSNYKETYRQGDDLENIIAKAVKKISEEIISNSPFGK